MVPPSMRLERPCLTEFSTKGCRSIGGICASISSWGTSMVMFSRSSNRAFSKWRYFLTNSNSSLRGTVSNVGTGTDQKAVRSCLLSVHFQQE